MGCDLPRQAEMPCASVANNITVTQLDTVSFFCLALFFLTSGQAACPHLATKTDLAESMILHAHSAVAFCKVVPVAFDSGPNI